MADYSFYTYSQDALVFDPGTGTFTLDAGYDFREDRNLIEYSDDDAVLDGLAYDGNGNGSIDDFNQIGSAYDDQGNLIESGSIYVSAYAELLDPNGNTIIVDRIEIDGVHVGYVPSAPLTPGVAYTVTFSEVVSDGNSNEMDHSYYSANSVPCFDAATRIATPNGPKAVIELRRGDLVNTLDDGPQPIRWRNLRRVNLRNARPDERPILVPIDALGPGRPCQELIVSGQHKILLGHPLQGAGLLPREALVSAKALLGAVLGVRLMNGRKQATWVHLALPKHSILIANGAYAESLLFGPMTMRGIVPLRRNGLRGMAERSELDLSGKPARPCLRVSEARRAFAAQKRACKCAKACEICAL